MKKSWSLLLLLSLVLGGLACAGRPGQATPESSSTNAAKPAESRPQVVAGGLLEKGKESMPSEDKLSRATFAGGCFWCTEAVFQELVGVYKVTSGYIGGTVENPTYRAVCSGETGHAEAIEIVYNPDEVTFPALLEVFFQTHDPTTLNQQGADRGTQYRSAVFYHDESQKQAATEIIAALEKEKLYPNPIVTEVTQATQFYSAEADHQDYYAINSSNDGYCQMVITPKMDKFRKLFADRIRKATR